MQVSITPESIATPHTMLQCLRTCTEWSQAEKLERRLLAFVQVTVGVPEVPGYGGGTERKEQVTEALWRNNCKESKAKRKKSKVKKLKTEKRTRREWLVRSVVPHYTWTS